MSDRLDGRCFLIRSNVRFSDNIKTVFYTIFCKIFKNLEHIMNSILRKAFAVFSIFFVALFLVNSESLAKTKKDKIKPEELITKHLESIGTSEARNAITSMMSVGRSKVVFKGRGTGTTEGLVVIASQAEKNMIGMKFRNPDYQYEAMGYDGEDFSVGYAKAGVRSTLGGFLRLNEKTFKSGILGGVLSTSWELLKYDKKRGRIKYKGTETIDGVELVKFEYNPRKGSDLDVMMFFDAQNFRHMRTEYKRVISSGLGRSVGANGRVNSRVDNSAQQSETRYKMVENFGDFKVVNGLNLPHQYNLYLEILTGNGSTAYDWKMSLQQFYFNQELGAEQFRVDNVQ